VLAFLFNSAITNLLLYAATGLLWKGVIAA